MALDPLRFRANVYVSGGLPWAEFDLLGQEILLGGARLRVFKRIVRCPATEVNPETAERDAKPPQAAARAFRPCRPRRLCRGAGGRPLRGGRRAGAAAGRPAALNGH